MDEGDPGLPEPWAYPSGGVFPPVAPFGTEQPSGAKGSPVAPCGTEQPSGAKGSARLSLRASTQRLRFQAAPGRLCIRAIPHILHTFNGGGSGALRLLWYNYDCFLGFRI